MTKFTGIKTEAIKLGQSLTELDQAAFFKYMHSKYYSHIDISFMKYFLELYESEEDYPVEHTALIKYGIMTCSDNSSKIKEKLKNLGLVNVDDYRLADVRQPVKQGGFSSKKVYHLTAKAFKICLMRAQRRAKQPVDPIIYNNYFLLLEEIHLLYNVYQKTRSDNKIIRLEAKIDQQTKIMLDEREAANKAREAADKERKLSAKRDKEQQAKIDKLLGYAQETKDHNEELIDKADELIDLNKITYDALVYKSFNSTMIPEDLDNQTHFVVYKEPSNLCDISLKMRTGTLRYIQSIDDKDKRVFKISPTANGMNLRQNIKSECVKNFSKLLDTTQTANSVRKITGIYFGSYEIRYKENDYISVSDILDVVQSVYDKTTKPPISRYG